MPRSRAVLTILALLAAVVLASCGSDDSGGSSTADQAAATSSTQAAPAPATTSQPAAATTAKETDATVAACHNRYDPYIATLVKIQASVDGTPNYRGFGAGVTKLGKILQNSSGQSDSTGCANAVGRFAAGSFLQFASATGTWAKCPNRSKCSAAERSFLEARLSLGRTNLAKARNGYSTMPTS